MTRRTHEHGSQVNSLIGRRAFLRPFRNANQSNLRGSLIEGNKVHLLNQARSELAKQELHVESLNECIGEQQRPTEEQRLALQDAQYGFVECRREQVRLQEELVMKEKALGDAKIRSMNEMGEMKRAQELRVEQFSIQKLRESHDTIQRVTSQILELQEKMNYLNDSGNFHEVESNKSGKCSHVPSQPARIPSPRAVLSCDKRLPPDKWNPSGFEENAVAIVKKCTTVELYITGN